MYSDGREELNDTEDFFTTGESLFFRFSVSVAELQHAFSVLLNSACVLIL